LDNKRYNVGEGVSEIPRAYLNRSALLSCLSVDGSAFRFSGFVVSNVTARFPYTPRRGAPADIVWPPKGVHLALAFSAPESAPAAHKDVVVTVHYEMYDGAPLLVKWVSVESNSAAVDVRASIDTVETLNLNWQWAQQGYNWLLVETDEPHGNKVTWARDAAEAAMPGSFEPLVNVTFDRKFNVSLKKLQGSYAVLS
jgi:hypothetical protein